MKTYLANSLRAETKKEKKMKAVRITNSIVILVDEATSIDEARENYLRKLQERGIRLQREFKSKDRTRNAITKGLNWD